MQSEKRGVKIDPTLGLQGLKQFALFPMEGAIERARPNEILQQNALSRLRLPLETMQIRCRFEL